MSAVEGRGRWPQCPAFGETEMHARRRWSLLLLGAGLIVLAGCDDRGRRGGWFDGEAANPDAAARQSCTDAGYQPGSVPYMQCMGRGGPERE